MKKSLIVAHYNENLNWLTNIPKDIKIYLYTKGNSDINLYSENIEIIKLENIGNEQHTYFYHINKNYNNLEDIMYFIQAGFEEHSHDLLNKIMNSETGGMSDINLITTVYGQVGNLNYHKHINHKYTDTFTYENVKDKIFIDPWNNNDAYDNINYIIDQLPELNIPKENWIFNANGMYGVTKIEIHKKDINIYNKCYNMFYTKPNNINMLEYAFERLNKFIIL